MFVPIYLDGVFVSILVVILVCLVGLTVFLVFEANENKKTIKAGESDYEILEDKVVAASRSPAQKGWAKAGGLFFDFFVGLLLVLFGLLIFTRAMPRLGVPYSLEAVKTPSMASVDPSNEWYLKDRDNRIQVNDIVVLKKVETISEVKLYDIVSYRHPAGINIIHRVIEVGDGYVYTRGDALDQDDGVKVKVEMINGLYTGVRIPYLGALTFYLQNDYGILGMVALAYCIIAAQVYWWIEDAEKEKRLTEYSKMFENGLGVITFAGPSGTVRFNSAFVGSVDANKKSQTVSVNYTSEDKNEDTAV